MMSLLHHNKSKAKKIALSNQKGGVGKTTTAINLSAGLARRGHRVLLIDLDPQANASAVFLGAEQTINLSNKEVTAYEVLTGTPVGRAIRQVELTEKAPFAACTLSLLPSHVRLARATIELQNKKMREHRLTNALKPVEHEYDYIIFDCPPALGLLTINVLMAARQVIIPIEPGYFPLIGLGLLQQTIAQLSRINRGLKLLGVLPTLQDYTLESQQTAQTLKQMYNGQLLPGIPRRVAVRYAHTAGLDIFGYDPKSDAAQAYAKLAEEVENRG